MVEATRRQALVISDRPWVCERLRELLPELEQQVAPGAASALSQIRDQAFAAVIIDYAAGHGVLRALLDVLRARDSAANRAALVVLAEPEALEEAEEQLGQTTARLVNPLATDERVRHALLDVVEHPARLPVRAVVKLSSTEALGRSRVIGQTQDLSLTGMLVRFDKPLPVGARLGFDLELPNEPLPLRGVGAVVRLAYTGSGDVAGFAMRFVTFEGDALRRLELALERLERLRPPSTA